MSEQPRRPDDSECCGSGCKPCIFDIYEEKVKKWKAGIQQKESKALNQIKYLPFLIKDIENISDVLRIFKFQSIILKSKECDGVFIKNSTSNIYDVLEEPLCIKPGEYLIMKGIYNGEIISRSYTPVLSGTFEIGQFTIIISIIENGKMSHFFKTLSPQDIVFWRGPYQEFTYKQNSHKHILLLGGGTGVVPLYNISKGIVENDEDDTWVTMICCFKTVQTILLRKEFRTLKDFWNFKMTTYISNEMENFDAVKNESIVLKKLDGALIAEQIKKLEDDFFVVVCGPKSFNDFVHQQLTDLGVKDNNIFIFY